MAVGRDRGLKEVHQLRRIGGRLAPRALAIETADGERGDAPVEGGFMLLGRVDEQRLIALARNLRRHPREEIVDECAAQADRLEIITAAIGRSEERRVGKEGVSTLRSRWSPSH